ncbi:MAG: YkgJ family cysteine cluster protein [Crenarchaeota archaeon]|nr:YkgJ family cysteine cluster protein [Thermoproteota archaeon]
MKCGACCETRSGVFAFENELLEIEQYIGNRVNVEHCENIRLLTGESTRVCTIASGKCPFYDVDTRQCAIHRVKPIICRVFFCTLVGKKGSRVYVKVRGPQGAPLYVEWTSDIATLRKKVRSFSLRLAARSSF